MTPVIQRWLERPAVQEAACTPTTVGCIQSTPHNHTGHNLHTHTHTHTHTQTHTPGPAPPVRVGGVSFSKGEDPGSILFKVASAIFFLSINSPKISQLKCHPSTHKINIRNGPGRSSDYPRPGQPIPVLYHKRQITRK